MIARRAAVQIARHDIAGNVIEGVQPVGKTAADQRPRDQPQRQHQRRRDPHRAGDAGNQGVFVFGVARHQQLVAAGKTQQAAPGPVGGLHAGARVDQLVGEAAGAVLAAHLRGQGTQIARNKAAVGAGEDIEEGVAPGAVLDHDLVDGVDAAAVKGGLELGDLPGQQGVGLAREHPGRAFIDKAQQDEGGDGKQRRRQNGEAKRGGAQKSRPAAHACKR